MTAAIPVSRANELFNEFTDLVRAENSPSEFVLAKFFRDAKAEVGRDPVPAYMLMGAVSAYKFDIDCMHRYHNIAINLEDTELTRSNYAVSLQVVSLMSEAAYQACIASERCPEDLGCLSSAIEYSWFAGQIESSIQLINLYAKRGGGVVDLLAYAEAAKRVFDCTGISESVYQRSLDVSTLVLRTNKVRPIRTTVAVDEDSGRDSSILVSYFVDLTQSAVDRLQGDLAEKMLDVLGDDWHPGAFMFEFVPK